MTAKRGGDFGGEWEKMEGPCDYCYDWVRVLHPRRIPEEELAEYRRMTGACGQHREYDPWVWMNIAQRLLEHIDALEAERSKRGEQASD